jgi:hypothetical protein
MDPGACVSITSLNKAYPKDEYPLPHICQIVDSMVSCELLSFLDAYLGHHQINLATNDEEKIVFITPFRIFCYTKMAFSLKNGGLPIRSVFISSWSHKLGEMLNPISMISW